MHTKRVPMNFDQVVDIWQEALAGRKLNRIAFVVASPLDGVLVTEVNVSECFRPFVLGTRGKTVAWAYAQCPNGEHLVAKIQQDASLDAVSDLLSMYIAVAVQ